jgi:hypothetical protein
MDIDQRKMPYNEGQPAMARTGIRRGLILGLLAFAVVMGLIAYNTRHEIRETASVPATTQSQPVAPKQ